MLGHWRGFFFGFFISKCDENSSQRFFYRTSEEVLSREGKIFYPKQKVFIETQAGKVRVQTAVALILGVLSIWLKQDMHVLAMDRRMIGMAEIRGARRRCRWCIFMFSRVLLGILWSIKLKRHWIGMRLGIRRRKCINMLAVCTATTVSKKG